jgi:glycine/D-amino acid oxidase-like deaminating enzyme
MRTTADRRVIIGGEDVPFKNAALRDRLLPAKVEAIEGTLRRLVPSLVTETAYSWTGTFAETDDGLPYIGGVAKYPGMLFALGYGGNGITFSVIAAEILSTLCRGGTVASAELYAMTR